MNESVSDKLKLLRESLDMKLKDVALGAGISESHLSRLESGERLPGFDALKGLCEVYGVSADSLLGLDWDITSLADGIAIEAKKCMEIYDLKELAEYYDVEEKESVDRLDALLTDYLHLRGLDNG